MTSTISRAQHDAKMFEARLQIESLKQRIADIQAQAKEDVTVLRQRINATVEMCRDAIDDDHGEYNHFLSSVVYTLTGEEERQRAAWAAERSREIDDERP